VAPLWKLFFAAEQSIGLEFGPSVAAGLAQLVVAIPTELDGVG
jgi:hypothetical protein